MTALRSRRRVLHVTPHLGGGVGRALLMLSEISIARKSDIEHSFILLEIPEKTQFVTAIQKLGCTVDIAPGPDVVRDLLASADVVQLEWWNHPATFRFLCHGDLPALRLVVWCHVSGTNNPVIPGGLIGASGKFLLTSPCSYTVPSVKDLKAEFAKIVDVVSSGGGFDSLPTQQPDASEPLRAGYLGSLNFSKLNPRYIEFLAAVSAPDFQVRLIGDVLNREYLINQCRLFGKLHLLEFCGYKTDVVGELLSLNVLVYLLNPQHYGTAEIALLEAMAMGVVPVVLDNPAEKAIVEDRITGLVVRSPEEFGQAIDWLSANPTMRAEMGSRAANFVRSTFTSERTERSLNSHYWEIMKRPKNIFDFRSIFGREPADWFLSCQPNPSRFVSASDLKESVSKGWDYSLDEKTKGSVYHFLKYFPNDSRLAKWAHLVERLR